MEKYDLMMIEMVLRWMVYYLGLRVKNGNDGILIGILSVDQLKNNLDNLEKGLLLEEVVKVLDEVWQVSKVDLVLYWYGDLEYGYDIQKVLFGQGVK